MTQRVTGLARHLTGALPTDAPPTEEPETPIDRSTGPKRTVHVTTDTP